LTRAEMMKDTLRMIDVLQALQIGEHKGNSGVSMQLFVKAGAKTLTVDVSRSDTIALLKAKILDKQGRLTYAGKPLSINTDTIESCNLPKHATLYQDGRGCGGGKLVKKALKKDELAAAVRRGIYTKVLKTHGLEHAVPKAGTPLLKEIVAVITASMEKIMKEHRKDGSAVKMALKRLLDPALREFDEHLEGKKSSGEKQEDRLTDLTFHLWPETAILDDVLDEMVRVKGETLATLGEILMIEFGSVKGGGSSMTFELEALKKLVVAQMNYRAGLEHGSEPAAPAAVEEMPWTSACVIC
jgi:hypothetical protein